MQQLHKTFFQVAFSLLFFWLFVRPHRRAHTNSDKSATSWTQRHYTEPLLLLKWLNASRTILRLTWTNGPLTEFRCEYSWNWLDLAFAEIQRHYPGCVLMQVEVKVITCCSLECFVCSFSRELRFYSLLRRCHLAANVRVWDLRGRDRQHLESIKKNHLMEKGSEERL